MPGTEEGQEIRSTGWAHDTSEASSRGGKPLNRVPEHSVAHRPHPAKGSAPTHSDLPYPGFHTKGVSTCLSSQPRPPAGTEMRRSRPLRGPLPSLILCHSGQFMTWRIRLRQRFYLQEAPGASFEPARKKVGVTADWPMSWRSWGN